MLQKEFIRADDLVRDAFQLARIIYDTGYRPDVLLVLWRGGTPVGVVIHEFLRYKGIETYHTVVKAESYTGIGRRREPVIENLDGILARLGADSRVLIIDDIFDTGCTLSCVRDRLLARTRHIRTATLYDKPGSHQTDLAPDFCLRKTENWIVFPHELMDLTPDEIREKDGRIFDLVGPVTDRGPRGAMPL